MNDKRRSRRVGTQHHLKPNFSSWFDAVKAHDERLERKARQQQQQQMQKGSSTNNNNKLWKIQVACVVERLPVVMPDKPSWLQDFIELQEYEQQFGKQYPSEFVGHNNAETYLKAFTGDDMKPPTDDELMGTFLYRQKEKQKRKKKDGCVCVFLVGQQRLVFFFSFSIGVVVRNVT